MKIIIIITIILGVFVFYETLANPIIFGPMNVNREVKKPDYFSELPNDKAELFQKKDLELKAKYRELNIQLKAATSAMNNALLAEIFNKDNYLKAVTAVRSIEEDKYTNKINAIAELAAQFDATERKVLVGAFEDNAVKKFYSHVNRK